MKGRHPHETYGGRGATAPPSLLSSFATGETGHPSSAATGSRVSPQGRRIALGVAVRIAVTLVVLVLLAFGIAGTRIRENPYPGLNEWERRLAQGLDRVQAAPGQPLDLEGARRHFEAGLAADVPNHDRSRLLFLAAWSRWAEGPEQADAARRQLRGFLAEFPASPFAPQAELMLALSEAESGSDCPPEDCAARLVRIAEGSDSVAAAHAAASVAGLFEERLKDVASAAYWCGRAYDLTEATHLPDERLAFLYRQGKLLQILGERDRAVEVFRRILETPAGSTGTWADRVLDRLDELGVPAESTDLPAPPPLTMTSHVFESDRPVEIAVSFWILFKTGMRRGVEEVVARYERRTPDVRVRIIDLPYAGYMDWLQSQVLGKEIPDIIQIDNGSAMRYGPYGGHLLDLSPYLAKTNAYTGVRWADMYYPQFLIGARDPVYRRNWIVSWGAENTAFFYNKRLYREAGIVERDAAGRPVFDETGQPRVAEPRTLAELREAYRRLRERGVYGEVCPFQPKPAPAIWQMPYLRKQIYDNVFPRFDRYTADDYVEPFEMARAFLSGELDLTDPELAAPWRILYDNSAYWLPGGTALGLPEALEAFAQERAATIFWVSTDRPTLEEMCGFEVGVFPFPLAVDSPYYDGEYAEEFTLSSFEFAVPRVVEERGTRDAVIDFLMYFTSPEAQAVLSREAVCASPIRGLEPPEALRPFVTRIDRRGTHMLPFDPYSLSFVIQPYWQQAWDELWNEFGRLVEGASVEAEHGNRRDQGFDAFTTRMQNYFKGAYDRFVRDYPVTLRRELREAHRAWLAAFCALYGVRETGGGGEESARAALNDSWRTILERRALLGRCEELVPGSVSAGAQGALSVEQQRRLGRMLRVALMVLCAGAFTAFVWSPAAPRALRDARYIAAVVPTLALLALFCYGPALSALYHSLFLWNGSDLSEFVGLANFRDLLTDEVLRGAVGVVLVFLVANVLKLVPTVLVALVLFHLAGPRIQYLFRVVFVLPMAIPAIVNLLIWRYFYRMDGGVLNELLLALGILEAPINWLGQESLVVPAMVFIGFPWVSTLGVLIFLAGFQSIPGSIFEAAYLEGCGAWRRLWHIELPLVSGLLRLNVILIAIGTLQDFWLPLVLTGGGPGNASMLPGLWMYQNAFSYGKMGYASAIGVAMFLALLLFTVVNMRLLWREARER